MAARPSSATSRRLLVTPVWPSPRRMRSETSMHERSHPQYGCDAGERTLRRACTRSGGACRAPAVQDKARCRMHGGAEGSGAPKGNRNARKHGLFTKRGRAEQRQIRDLLGEAGRLLRELK
ncbi:HGGxSTG domain-containing protein [Bradyrhizobium liaoningense]|uniref:HGGxSTG domain-containing protein n=1 Tax=Bradyrhizobium liaoningense TaxID=43992 RepID=UPI00289E7DD9|nr:HGGxSTG domain-containing protein [Bradyrhizobium liaoningense]